MRMMLRCLLGLVLAIGPASASAQSRDTTLDVYFIDVEGGQATLLVSLLENVRRVALEGRCSPAGLREWDRIWYAGCDKSSVRSFSP